MAGFDFEKSAIYQIQFISGNRCLTDKVKLLIK